VNSFLSKKTNLNYFKVNIIVVENILFETDRYVLLGRLLSILRLHFRCSKCAKMHGSGVVLDFSRFNVLGAIANEFLSFLFVISAPLSMSQHSCTSWSLTTVFCRTCDSIILADSLKTRILVRVNSLFF